jgi:circadian clock protein KaiB
MNDYINVEEAKTGQKQDLMNDMKKVEQNKKSKYFLTLYISGATNRSKLAIENIKRICEENLKGRYILEVVDLFQEPEKARKEQIIVLPTLIKSLPAPIRKFIGDLSDKDSVLVGLELKEKISNS